MKINAINIYKYDARGDKTINFNESESNNAQKTKKSGEKFFVIPLYYLFVGSGWFAKPSNPSQIVVK